MEKFLNLLKNSLKNVMTYTVRNMKLFTTIMVITWMVFQIVEVVTGIGDGASVFQILIMSMLLDIYLES